MKTNKEILRDSDDGKDHIRNSYNQLYDSDISEFRESKKFRLRHSREQKEIRTLRKSKSIKKVSEKKDLSRFTGIGLNFKAKLIGIDTVNDARGDKMCQESLQKLKMVVKTSGEHKQKIVLNVSLGGIRIKEDKTGEVIHHHPVHKISFISQDVSDGRAFGYVYGCPQTGHQFFAIKTEKAASQVVICLRDLFQVVLEMKKKEMEKAIQLQKDWNDGDHPEDVNEIIKEGDIQNGAQNSSEQIFRREQSFKSYEEHIYSDVISLPEEDVYKPASSKQVSADVQEDIQVENLLDLQIELDTLQQGIEQMDCSIAASASFGFGLSYSEDDNSISSGNSLTLTPRKMDSLSSSIHLETVSTSSRSSISEYSTAAAETISESDCTFGAAISEMKPDFDCVFSTSMEEIKADFSSAFGSSMEEIKADFSSAFGTSMEEIKADFSSAFGSSAAETKSEPEGAFATTSVETKSDSDYGFSASSSIEEEGATLKMPSAGISATVTPSSSLSLNSHHVEEKIEDKYAVFADIDSLPSIFDNPVSESKLPESEKETDQESTLEADFGNINVKNHHIECTSEENSLDHVSEISKEDIESEILEDENNDLPNNVKSELSVFAELDPLGKDHPYIDKKDFFHEIKNPPKKVLKDLVERERSDSFSSCDSFVNSVPISNENAHVSNGDVDSSFESKFNCQFSPPPRLPPKQPSASVTSTVSSVSFTDTDNVDNLPVKSVMPDQFLTKSSFNPFYDDDCEGIPNFSPPPPPPPPRLPMRGPEPMFPPPSPPPRPPSRTCAAPTPPLPRRKPPLAAASKAWFSFDQDVSHNWYTAYNHHSISEKSSSSSPPIPAPARKPPLPSRCDSPVRISVSANNSPFTSRRHLHRTSTSDDIDVTNSQDFFAHPFRRDEFYSTSGTKSGRNFHNNWAGDSVQINGSEKSPSKSHFSSSSSCRSSVLPPYSSDAFSASPPLPPKSSFVPRPRPSPSRHMGYFSNSFYPDAISETADDVFPPDEEFTQEKPTKDFRQDNNVSPNKISTNGNDNFSENGFEPERKKSECKEEPSANPTSPDSIFRRKSDPFADDFFTSLPKKSDSESSRNVSPVVLEKSPDANKNHQNGFCDFEVDWQKAEEEYAEFLNVRKEETT